MTGAARAQRLGRSLKPFRRPWLWVGLWCALVALVVYASLMPADDLPRAPEGADKIEHFLAYALLAAGAVQLFARRLSLLSACVALVLLGIAIEFAQGDMGLGRAADASDALANVLGVLAGLASLLTPWRDALLRFDTRRR